MRIYSGSQEKMLADHTLPGYSDHPGMCGSDLNKHGRVSPLIAAPKLRVAEFTFP
jgi:hypothetical protein